MIEQYEKILKEHMGRKRYEHSIAVSKEAVKLAKFYDVDLKKAKTAAILHDIAKEMPESEQLQIINRFGIIMSDVEKNSKKLWHAIVGKAYVQNVLGIDDTDILNAIRYHTTARQGMSKLEKIVYIADLISADRKYDNVDKLRKIAYLNLDEAIIMGLGLNFYGLSMKKYLIAPDSVFAYNELLTNLQK